MLISVDDVDPLLKEDISDFQTTPYKNLLKELLWRASTRRSEPYSDDIGNDLLAAALHAVQHSQGSDRRSIMVHLEK